MELSDLFDALAGYLEFCVNLLCFRSMGAYSRLGSISPALVTYFLAGFFFAYVVVKSKTIPGYHSWLQRQHKDSETGTEQEKPEKEEPVTRAVDHAAFVLMVISGTLVLHLLLRLYSAVIYHAEIGSAQDTLNAVLGTGALYYPMHAMSLKCWHPLNRYKPKSRPAGVLKRILQGSLICTFLYLAFSYPIYMMSITHGTSYMYIFWWTIVITPTVVLLVFVGVLLWVFFFAAKLSPGETALPRGRAAGREDPSNTRPGEQHLADDTLAQEAMHMDANPQIEVESGILVLLDALGYRSWSLEESIRNMTKLLEVVNAIRGSEGIQEKLTQQGLSSSDFIPRPMTFGDTVLIRFKADQEKPWVTISVVSQFVAQVVYGAFRSGVLIRGAMTYGDYCCSQSDNIVLGPAITDAASWYEQPQLIGVVGTPRFTMFAREYYARLGEEQGGLLFKHSIMLKNGTRREMDTLGWPALMYSMEPEYSGDINRFRMMEGFRRLLSNYYFPGGAELKMEETINLFDLCLERLFDIVPKKIRGKPDPPIDIPSSPS